ncbi:hypothetical protein OHB54_44605 [Streptomyces sp. NBC_01007]|nr:hypothetical protein OHB54_44605 [Streptomyces sp. NBC_01007]
MPTCSTTERRRGFHGERDDHSLPAAGRPPGPACRDRGGHGPLRHELLYASNAGSSTLSGFRTSDHGRRLTLLGNTPTHPGTVDAATTPDGHYLYAQTGVNGIVDEFAVNDDGSLTPLGSRTVPGGVGGEGIVAP